MRRRHLLPIALCLQLSRLAWAQQQPAAPEPEEEDSPQALPHYKVSAARLQAAVAQRFPLRYPLEGLMNLDVQVPQLRLLPALNRMGAEMVVLAAGPAWWRCSTPIAPRWPSARCWRWCCTRCARKTWRCPIPWACSRAALP